MWIQVGKCYWSVRCSCIVKHTRSLSGVRRKLRDHLYQNVCLAMSGTYCGMAGMSNMYGYVSVIWSSNGGRFVIHRLSPCSPLLLHFYLYSLNPISPLNLKIDRNATSSKSGWRTSRPRRGVYFARRGCFLCKSRCGCITASPGFTSVDDPYGLPENCEWAEWQDSFSPDDLRDHTWWQSLI